jgi:hypothetical protein
MKLHRYLVPENNRRVLLSVYARLQSPLPKVSIFACSFLSPWSPENNNTPIIIARRMEQRTLAGTITTCQSPETASDSLSLVLLYFALWNFCFWSAKPLLLVVTTGLLPQLNYVYRNYEKTSNVGKTFSPEVSPIRSSIKCQQMSHAVRKVSWICSRIKYQQMSHAVRGSNFCAGQKFWE